MVSEKRLIYMDDTMNKLRAYADRKHAAGHNDLANGILKAVSYIRNNMVRVDAVEVVRCGECRWARAKDHREPTDTPKQLICQCFKHHHIPAPWGARLAVNPDDFCSYGERKTTG